MEEDLIENSQIQTFSWLPRDTLRIFLRIYNNLLDIPLQILMHIK